jgi:PAS domain-containing protein
MINEQLATLFAPAERATPEEIEAQHEKVSSQLLLRALMDCFPEPAMILNRQRQIVLANDKLAHLLGRPRDSLIGLRPGEAVGCIHATERAGGCGTTSSCRYCGAVKAILNSQRSAQPEVEECRIQCVFEGRAAALDLRVWATPLVVDDESFTVFAIRDTTDEKKTAPGTRTAVLPRCLEYRRGTQRAAGNPAGTEGRRSCGGQRASAIPG